MSKLFSTSAATGIAGSLMDTPQVRFNWGFWDARADRENGRRDRQLIPSGELFCLPSGDDPLAKNYRLGYSYGFRDEHQLDKTSSVAWDAANS